MKLHWVLSSWYKIYLKLNIIISLTTSKRKQELKDFSSNETIIYIYQSLTVILFIWKLLFELFEYIHNKWINNNIRYNTN